MLCKIRRSLLHVYHSSSLNKGIIWEVFRFIKVETFILIELVSEIIAINDSEDSSVAAEVDSEVQILPGVVDSCIFTDWDLMSLQEDALGDATVFNSLLNDMDGIIVQIVVDDALPDSEVLIWVLNYWLLEVGCELEDL